MSNLYDECIKDYDIAYHYCTLLYTIVQYTSREGQFPMLQLSLNNYTDAFSSELPEVRGILPEVGGKKLPVLITNVGEKEQL